MQKPERNAVAAFDSILRNSTTVGRKNSGTIDDLRIERNRIVGAASTGIDLNAIGSVVSLAENTVIDPGVGVEADLSRCGIRLRGKLKGVKVVGNAIYTHRDPPIVCGIRIETDDSDQFVFERNAFPAEILTGFRCYFPKWSNLSHRRIPDSTSQQVLIANEKPTPVCEVNTGVPV